MLLQFCSILLLPFGLAALKAIKPQFQCRINSAGDVNVQYNGDSVHIAFPASSNKTHHLIDVCLYSSIGGIGTRMRVSYIYHVLCQKNAGGLVKTLDVTTGISSEISLCLDALGPQRESAEVREAITKTTTETIVSPAGTISRPAMIYDDVNQNDYIKGTADNISLPDAIHDILNKTLRPDDNPGPTASLAVVNAYGYLVTRVLTSESLRMRIQYHIDNAHLPPIIGQCWYSLIKAGEERIVVASDVKFVEYGCSVQNENQLFNTNMDVFFTNGLSEQVSYPFNLKTLYSIDFNHMYMHISCQAYFCSEELPCRARCPPSQTTYQVSGFPLKSNLTTKIFVESALPATEAILVTEPNIVRIPRTTPRPHAASKSMMDKVQPFLVIGTLVITAIILMLIGGAVFRIVAKKFQDKHEDKTGGIFHTNANMDEHSPPPHYNKDSQRLIENQHFDSRHGDGIGAYHGNNQRMLENMNPKYIDHQRLLEHLQLSSRQGYHGNQRELEGLHLDPRLGVAHQSNQRLLEHLNHNSRQDWRLPSSNQVHHHRGNTSPNVVSLPKIVRSPQQSNVTMASPAYISRTSWRSPEGVINYGYEDDGVNKNSNHYSNRKAERMEPYSPVGGEIYQGHRPVRELFRDKKDRAMNRAHRSDTALLNEALREYFENHGMIN